MRRNAGATVDALIGFEEPDIEELAKTKSLAQFLGQILDRPLAKSKAFWSSTEPFQRSSAIRFSAWALRAQPTAFAGALRADGGRSLTTLFTHSPTLLCEAIGHRPAVLHSIFRYQAAEMIRRELSKTPGLLGAVLAKDELASNLERMQKKENILKQNQTTEQINKQ